MGSFTVRDSLLSEYAAVGFEYGYSVEAPRPWWPGRPSSVTSSTGREIIIDNFLVAAEDKWGQHSGLVLLLPHGYEGQGPEHSSARFERFLALCAAGNMRVTLPSTAAQYFHLLRSQARRAPRVHSSSSPPSPCCGRTPLARCSRRSSGSFRQVIDDPAVADPASVRRIVLGSGKIAHEAWPERRAGSSRRDRPWRPTGGHRPGGAALPVAGRCRSRLVLGALPGGH